MAPNLNKLAYETFLHVYLNTESFFKMYLGD
jgi:hypothetical protein